MPEAESRLGWQRLAIGLVQGLLLYGLYHAGETRAWPSSSPVLFGGLALALTYAPLAKIQGLSAMRWRTLAIWIPAATLILFGLGAWDRFRAGLTPDLLAWKGAGVPPQLLPRFVLFAFAGAGLFVAQALIAAADGAGKWIASYEAYFDTAWKQGVQLALSVAFVAAFWAILELGAGLFHLIHLDFFRHLIEHDWFAIPATTLAAAVSLHLTDIRAGLIAGLRGVALVLLSWLLPLLALLAAAFLASLLFTGLEPLWQTRSAAALLLTAAAGLVVLINAAWQAGPTTHVPPLALRAGGTAAALLLVPLVALAAYAVALRVGQYGWSEERVVAAAVLVVAVAYAGGYAWAALGGSILKHRWLAGLAPVNIWTAFLVLAAILALFSPLCDPARIAVSSQVARLRAGKVEAAKFDYRYLRFDAGRFGREALADLAAHPPGKDASTVARLAKAALEANSAFEMASLTPEEVAAQLTIYPKDYPLPKSLLARNTRKPWGMPECLSRRGVHCDVFPAELTGMPLDQLIFIWQQFGASFSAVLESDASGQWTNIGSFPGLTCPSVIAALKAGQYAVVAPEPTKYRDLEAGGLHMRLPEINLNPVCPKAH